MQSFKEFINEEKLDYSEYNKIFKRAETILKAISSKMPSLDYFKIVNNGQRSDGATDTYNVTLSAVPATDNGITINDLSKLAMEVDGAKMRHREVVFQNKDLIMIINTTHGYGKGANISFRFKVEDTASRKQIIENSTKKLYDLCKKYLGAKN